MPTESLIESVNVEVAVDKIRDALRYVDICSCALDSSRDSPRNEVMITLENDVVGALTEALEALGYPRFSESSQGAEVSHA